MLHNSLILSDFLQLTKSLYFLNNIGLHLKWYMNT